MQIMQIKCTKYKKIKKTVDISANLYYTYVRNRDEAWLSLVERCVRDAEVASSNLVASTYLNTKACWSSGQDDALSRRKPGFDSRTGHRKLLWVFQSIFQIKMLPWLSWQSDAFVMRRSSVQVRVSARIFRFREAHEKCASLVFMCRFVQNAGCFSTAVCFCRQHGVCKNRRTFLSAFNKRRKSQYSCGFGGG